MSAASLVVALGMAGNIVRFIDFGMRLCYRIQEYSATDGAPEKLAAQANCLSDLLYILGNLAEAEQDALERSLIFRCAQTAVELSKLLDTLIDRDRYRRHKWRYARKAWKSLHFEKRVESLQRTLESLLEPLSLLLQMKTTQQTLVIKRQVEEILQRQGAGLISSADCRPTSKGLIVETIVIIPIARNPNFVGREKLLKTLDERLSLRLCGQPKVALYGLGGVGKSQIALEYAYRFTERSPECSIFWVNAANTARFEEAYRRIASEYEMPGLEDPKEDPMQLVRNWLECRYKGLWLMIVDNVDDISMFFRKNGFGKSLSEYIPQSSKGAILYTTRDRNVGANLVPSECLIGVPRMDHAEAQIFLGGKVIHKGTEEEQSKLLEGLDYLPLAISQAATFMTEVGLTIPQYLSYCRHSYSTRIGLLGYEFADHGRGERPMESVATTWMISFNNIQKQNPRAAHILALMSFLGRHEIPRSLLAGRDENPLDFTKAIGMLGAFSLITADDGHENYKVHLLVQLATRLWLARTKKGPLALELALESVASYFPNGEYEHWATCRIYLPHAEAVMNSAREEYPSTNVEAQATILLNASCYFRRQGNFETAEAKARMSVRLRQEALGTKHPDTLASISNLASVLHDKGNYEAAESMNRQALEGRVDVLGKDDPETLISFSNLASALQDQGRHKEAENMNREALEGHRKVLGNHHPDTLASLSNLALVLQQQGKLEEAEEMHRRAFKGSKMMLGTEHPDTLVSLQNLAEALRDQARYGESEEMHRQALDGLERVLGREHPFTLTSLHNLAEVLRYQGKYDEAEERHWRALKGSEKVLGTTHPYTLTSLHNLAELLWCQEKYDDAEGMYRLVLERRGKILGMTHPDTLASASCLALVLRDQGKYRKAQKANHQAPKEYTEVHPDTRAIRNNLASVLQHRYQGKYVEAEIICFTECNTDHCPALAGASNLSAL